MRSRITPSVLAILFGLIAANNMYAQPAPIPPREVRLPEPDPRIQAWLTALTDTAPRPDRDVTRPEFYKELFAPLAEARAALQGKTMTEEAWFTQILLFVSQKEGEDAWVTIIQLMLHSRTILGLQSRSAIPAIVPYLESPQPRVAQYARDMIAYSIGFSGQPIANAMQDYLRSTLPGDPSWQAVVFLYYSDEPENALRTAAAVYVDRATQQQIDRMRKELTILIYSHDLAAADRKAEWSKQIAAKLDEFAGHAHWSARAYVPAKLVKERSSTWSREPATLAIVTRLSSDPNPAVAELGQAALRLFRIR